MGIVNMMIVIPMILQTLSFGWIYRHLLKMDPGNVMYFAAGLLGLAALATVRMKVPEPEAEDSSMERVVSTH